MSAKKAALPRMVVPDIRVQVKTSDQLARGEDGGSFFDTVYVVRADSPSDMRAKVQVMAETMGGLDADPRAYAFEVLFCIRRRRS